jgi:hypothetical protein
MRTLIRLAVLGCFAACPLSAGAQSDVQFPPPVSTESPAGSADAVPCSQAESSSLGTFTVIPEYILWSLREGRVPALLTTGPTATEGVLGQKGTRVLYGDDRLPTRHDDRFNGVRLSLAWMSAGGEIGVEARGFILERDSTHFRLDSDGSQLLASPYFNPLNGQQASQIIAGKSPLRGLLSGSFVGYSRIEWFGEELNGVIPLRNGCDGWRLDLLAGARFLQMRDRFEQTGVSYTAPGNQVLFSDMDNIRTSTIYYGGQLGLRTEYQWGRLFVQLRGEIGIGGDDEMIKAFGQSVVQTAVMKLTFPVGLYVQPSNSGNFSRWNFDGVGEVDLNVGYKLTRWMRLFAGYTFLYWADPLRAGDQIDTVVNRAQAVVPTPGRPRVSFKGDALWAQGVNAGVQLTW